MQFQPYLMFDGTCAEAMRFYERVLGARIEALMTYAGAPAGCARRRPTAPGGSCTPAWTSTAAS